MKIKIHKSYRDVIAVCDSNLLGKTFEQGKMQLNVKETFFGGEEIEPENLLQVIKDMDKEDATFNIVGENSINIALKAGIIKKQGIKTIQEIPFALVLL